jgi:apolipoprotein N-acyltransferase
MASPLVTEAPAAAVPVAPPAPAPLRRRFSLALAAPLTSGVLLYLCYFPVSWGWLAWFALVPLFGLVRSTRRARVLYPCVMLAGWASYTGSLQWMRVADPRMAAAWIFLAFYCSLYWLLALRLLRYLDRRTRLPLVLTAPVVWVALEFLRSNLGPGFSWYLLGYSQHRFLPIIQIADLAGVYGVSFVVAAVNGLFAEVLLARAGWFRSFVGAAETEPQTSRFGLLVRGLGVFALAMATLAYGSWRLSQDVRTPGPRIALLQGNLDQRLRNQSSDPNDPHRAEASRRVDRHFIDLSFLASRYGPDLIVWPETSYFQGEWLDIDADVPPENRPSQWQVDSQESAAFARIFARTFGDYAGRYGQPRPAILLGINSRVLIPEGPNRYNSAVLIAPDGRVEGRYDKIHRVPLGEYIPFKTWLPFLKYFAPYDFDYSIAEGRGHTRFPLGKNTFGVVICYEDTIPYVNLPYGGGDGQPSADFVLNISNDGWFNGSSEHQEHLALCRFRAIENRRPYARAVNMGISAVIDGNGRVLRPHRRDLPADWGRSNDRVWEVDPQAEDLPVSEWEDYKKVSGVLLATMPLDRRRALYPLVGDWLPGSCWLGLGLCLAWTTWRRFRHRACSESAGASG